MESHCGNRERGKNTAERSCTRMKQNLFIFTEQAENSQYISMTSSVSDLLFFFPPSSLSLCRCVLYLHLSPALCSGSGSGNRSVTCHYWSNSVIRHRALTVCSALYAGTAGVLRTEVEIRFDTHTQARGPTGAGADGRCVYVCTKCVSTFVCVYIRESGKGKH